MKKLRTFKIMVTFFKSLVFSFTVLFLISCQNEERREELAADQKAQATNQVIQDKFNAQNVFNTLPKRDLVLDLINRHKLEYNADYLSNPINVNKFTLELYRAVNMGVYGADVCISNSFGQTQESVIFFKSMNNLASSLGVSSAFNQSVIDRIELNKNNNDSVINIITAAFEKADEILKYNNRAATAAVILCGSWIEGFYVSCKMAEKANSTELIKTIMKQKESLKNVIGLLENAGLEDNSKFIIDKLHGLFHSISTNESYSNFHRDAILKAYHKISDLRNQVVYVGQ